MTVRSMFIFVLLTFLPAVAVARTDVDPPAKTDLVGDWIGFDDHALSFYRLKVQSNEVRLATSYPKADIRIFAPATWKQTKGQVQFTARSDGFDVEVTGRAEWTRLVLNMKQKNGTWGDTITFYREDKITSRLKEIREQMEKTATTSEKDALELAKIEFKANGRKLQDFNASITTDSTGQRWIVWFEQKGRYSLPGGTHAVTVDKAQVKQLSWPANRSSS